MNHDNKLKSELKQAGASSSEANELAGLAASLARLKLVSTVELPTRKFERRFKWSGLMPIGLASITGTALGMALVLLSQTTLPGNLLYPVQKLFDNVATSVDPNNRGIIMMKRAQQVKQLVASHASSNLVLATLSDYKAEASAYKSAPANYAAFEYCKSNLQQAATMAPSPERQAIESTLSSLQNI